MRLSVGQVRKRLAHRLPWASPDYPGLSSSSSTHVSRRVALSATLPTTALAAAFRPPPGPAATPTPPPLGRLLTRLTAIPRLRIPRLKEPLAPIQQATAPPRPWAKALSRKRSSIMLKKTQGSAPEGHVLQRSPLPLRNTLCRPPYPSVCTPSTVIAAAPRRQSRADQRCDSPPWITI